MNREAFLSINWRKLVLPIVIICIIGSVFALVYGMEHLLGLKPDHMTFEEYVENITYCFNNYTKKVLGLQSKLSDPGHNITVGNSTALHCGFLQEYRSCKERADQLRGVKQEENQLNITNLPDGC